MIEKFLKPKKEKDILHYILCLDSPVQRFTLLFEFHFKKNPTVDVQIMNKD